MKWLHHFLVYRCIGCAQATQPPEILCDSCRMKLKEETSAPCSCCGVPHISCGCFANGRKNPFVHVMHIAPYRRAGVAHNIITGCKRHRDLSLFHFVAQTLACEIPRRISLTEETVIVNIPRSGRARRNYGFDQAEHVAKAIAQSLDIPYLCALKHHGARLQKTLNYRERLKNAEKAFSIKESAAGALRGKHVILYDDVVTTGASALACKKLLDEAGASAVDFVSFAKTDDGVKRPPVRDS